MKNRRQKFEIILLLSLISLVSIAFHWHTFYASTTSIRANEKGEISVKLQLFSDDLETAMSQASINHSLGKEAQIRQYVEQCVKLEINGQDFPWEWKPIITSGENTQCQWDIPIQSNQIHTIAVKNTLIIDAIEQQVNIMRFYLKGEKLFFNFNKQIKSEIIEYGE